MNLAGIAALALGALLAGVGPALAQQPSPLDPRLVFASYRGGAADDFAQHVEADAVGDVYLMVNTRDAGTVPQTPRTQRVPLETTTPGGLECVLTKLARDGREALYTVIFEGVQCGAMDLDESDPAGNRIHLNISGARPYLRTLREAPGGQIVIEPLQGAYDLCQSESCGPVDRLRADGNGNVYFTMLTVDSTGQWTYELRKVDRQGALVGTRALLQPPVYPDNSIQDQITGFDVDDAGNAYVIGYGATDGLITPTPDALRGTRPSGSVCTDPLRLACYDAFILQVDTDEPIGFLITYASYLGGVGDDRLFGVAWDRGAGRLYVSGTSSSTNFPTTPGAFRASPPIPGSPGGAFLIKLDLNEFPASQIEFSTFVTATWSAPTSLTVLPGGLAAMAGQGDRAFLSVFSADGASLRLFSYLDKTPGTETWASVVASNGSATAYVAMTTNDPALATPGSLQPSLTGGYEAVVQAIDVTGIVPANSPPAIALAPASLQTVIVTPTSLASVPVICGRLFACDVTDADGDAITHQVWLGPDGRRLPMPGGVVSLGVGEHTFTLLARDERGGIGTGTLVVTVSGENTFLGGPQRVVLTDARFVDDSYRLLGSVQPIEVTFPNVTAAGLTWLDSRSDLQPAPPPRRQAGSPPYYYEVRSTATFDGPIAVCVNTRGASFARPHGDLLIYRADGDSWTALENSWTPTDDQVCAETPQLGTFAIFYVEVPETAITTIAGGDVPLTRPGRLALQTSGGASVYVADNGGDGTRMRRLDLASGVLSDVPALDACHGFAPMAVDQSGRYFYCVHTNADTGLQDIVEHDLFTLGQRPVASAPEVLALALDAGGNLFYSDGNVFRVTPGGEPRLMLSYANPPAPVTLPYFDRAWTLAFDRQQHLLAGGFTLVRVSPGADGVIDGSADEGASTIGGIPGANLSGYAEPLGGDGLPASQAVLMFTYQMVVADDGAVVFTDQSSRIRRISPGADGVVDGSGDEIVRTTAGFFSSTLPSPSPFATSEFGDFRGIIEDPFTPGAFIVSSHGRGVLQRFGLSPAIYGGGGGPSDTLPPTAVIAAPATVLLGASVTALAEGSTDAGGGQIVSYIWTLVERALTVQTTVPAVTFASPPAPGVYHVQLVVVDNSGNQSQPATATVEVIDPPTGAPVADAYSVPHNSTLVTGARLVKEWPPTHPARLTASPRNFVNLGGTLFFLDDVSILHRADGTATGTTSLGVRARHLTVFNGKLFFQGTDTTHGPELWTSDGTVAGTVMLKDIVPGSLDSGPHEFTNVNGTLFFLANAIDAVRGIFADQLWRTDGTAAGTVLVKTFASWQPHESFLRAAGGMLYFRRTTGTDFGLWRSDGTPEGTVRVSTMEVHGFGTDPRNPTWWIPWYPHWPVALGDTLFLLGWDGLTNVPAKLFTVDTVNGVRPVVLPPAAPGQTRIIMDLAVANGRAYFGIVEFRVVSCNEPPAILLCTYEVRREVWSTDGTPEGTSRLTTFGPFTNGGVDDRPFAFTASGGNVFFIEAGALWRTDGTTGGTVKVFNGPVQGGHESTGPAAMTDVNGTLYFIGRTLSPQGTHLWRTDGTAAGTVLASLLPQGTDPLQLTNVNGTLFFTIPDMGDGVTRGHQLWAAGPAPGVLANDEIPAGALVTASVAQPVSHGTLLLNADGTFVYRPHAGFAGVDTFTYTFSDGVRTSNPATVTITVGAVPPPAVTIADATVVEGTGPSANLVFNVSRTGDLSGPSTVAFATGGGSAIGGTDYAMQSGTLTFAAGESAKQVVVAVEGDAGDESDEFFFVTLSAPVNAVLGRPRAFGLIVNDDVNSDLEVAVSGAPNPVIVGSPLTYQVVIRNHGPRPATGAWMTLPISGSDVSAVSATSPAGFCVVPLLFVVPGGTVSCDAGSIPVDGQVTLTVTVTPRRHGPLSATFTVGSSVLDLRLADNAATVVTTVAPLPVTVRTADDAYVVRRDSTLAAGATRVLQLPPDVWPRLSPPFEAFTNVNGTLYFVDNTGRLSRSDGTAAGTVRGIGTATHIRDLASFNGRLVFQAVDAAHGAEVWISDGTAAGTALLADLIPGPIGSAPREFTTVNGTLFFVADIVPSEDQGVVGHQVWRSDGTAAGTIPVKTFLPQADELFLRDVGGTLYFRARDASGRGLWRSDGTPEGTVTVRSMSVFGQAEIRHDPNFTPWYPNWPVVVGGTLIFGGNANAGATDANLELWRADAAGGATLLMAATPQPGHARAILDFAEANGRLYFGVVDTVNEGCLPEAPLLCTWRTTRELWSSDGTTAGTSLVTTFGPTTAGSIDGTPFLFTASGGTVFFVQRGALWKTDGTAAGTVLVNAGPIGYAAGVPKTLTDVDGTLFYVGRSGGWYAIWKSDGTPSGTAVVQPVASGHEPQQLTDVDGALFYTVFDNGSGLGHQLWAVGPQGGVLANDEVLTTQPVSVSVVQPPSHGTLQLNADGTFVYRPNAGFTGTDTFAYTATDGTFTSAPATVTIDVEGATPAISVTDAMVAEGNAGTAALVFTVTRAGDLAGTSTVDFATGGGSATGGSDYATQSGALTFATGESAKQIVVFVTGDTADEADEAFFVTLSNAANATLARAKAFGTIVNDDFDADLSVAATASPNPVVVNSTLTYQVVITNHGPRPATGVTLTLPMAGGNIVRTAGTIQVAGQVTLSVEVTPTVVGALSATFTVSAQQTDHVPGNNSVTVQTTVSPQRTFVDRGGVRYPAVDSSGNPTPVVVQFTTVTLPGILLADPMPLPPPPPAGLSFISQVFDVTTTASFSGLATVCIGGAGLTAQDRLLHFNGSGWGDVTVGGAGSPGQVCGQSATLSPFAVARPISCDYVSLALSPATVTAGKSVRVDATLRACAPRTETVVLRFTLSAPARGKGCSAVKTTMLTTPGFKLSPGFSRSVSFAFPIPKAFCAGSYSITVETLVGGSVVDSTTASLTVVRGS